MPILVKSIINIAQTLDAIVLPPYAQQVRVALTAAIDNARVLRQVQVLDSPVDTPAPPGGSNTQVQFNDLGLLGGSSGLTYDKTTNTVTFASGTQTTAVPAIRTTQTWNNAATVFDADVMEITQTAAATGSYIFRRVVNGVDVVRMDRDGGMQMRGARFHFGTGFTAPSVSINVINTGLVLNSFGSLWWSSTTGLSGTTTDTSLSRLSVNTLGVGSGPAPGAGGNLACKSIFSHNFYNTSTDYERLAISWAANACTIGMDYLGTGVARDIYIKSSGLLLWGTYVNISSTAGVFSTGLVPQGDGILLLRDAVGNSYGRIMFGGNGTSHPAIKRSGSAIHIRLANDSAFAPIVADTVQTGIDYTVATLPAAGSRGRRAHVTDALTPTFLGVLVGGGAVVCPAFDNGTAWVAG